MKWNHIMDSQPDHGRSIVQINAPYEGHYSMGMRNYHQICTWQEFLNFCLNDGIGNPDFWWMYPEDFPFPDKYNE